MAAAVPAIDLPGSRQEPRPVDLEVFELCLSWNGTGSVIDRLSFIVRQGQAVALIGPNGSGKTTLMRLLLALVRPQSGSVRLLGEELGSLDGARLRRLRAQVGLIWQCHNLVPRLSVLTNVVHGALCRSANPALWRQGSAPCAVREEALRYSDRVLGLTRGTIRLDAPSRALGRSELRALYDA